MNIPKPFYGVRVIAFDIFGTILASNDSSNEPLIRTGTINLLEKCVNKRIEICTCSDADISDLKNQLLHAKLSNDSQIPSLPLLNYFNEFFEMLRGEEKNIARITDYYGSIYAFKPEEILVIGDIFEIDIKPAQDLGCQTLPVPGYRIFKPRDRSSQPDDFDFSKIEINR